MNDSASHRHRRVRRRVTAMAIMLITTGCTTARMEIVHDPRACTGADERPPARSGYPAAWSSEGWAARSASYDMMLRFEPPQSRPNHFLVQRLDYHARSWDWNRESGQCDLARSDSSAIDEVLRARGNDVQFFFHPASRAVLKLHVSGKVGYVQPPTGRPFPAIEASQNAAFLNLLSVPVRPVYLDTLPPSERRKLLQRADDATFTQYEYRYEYDGCHPHPATACGERHCLVIRWWDVRDGRRDGPVRTRTFAGGGGPPCPVLASAETEPERSHVPPSRGFHFAGEQRSINVE